VRRIAAPVVGGPLSAMVLALIVLPVVYTFWREAQLARGRFSTTPGTATPTLEGKT